MRKEDLDKRMCDVDPNRKSTLTYREYIDSGYSYIGTHFEGDTLYERTADLDTKTDKDLTAIIEELDWLLGI